MLSSNMFGFAATALYPAYLARRDFCLPVPHITISRLLPCPVHVPVFRDCSACSATAAVVDFETRATASETRTCTIAVTARTQGLPDFQP